jgi:hypothetical protein
MEPRDATIQDQNRFKMIFADPRDQNDDDRSFSAGDEEVEDSCFVFDLEDLAIIGRKPKDDI